MGDGTDADAFALDTSDCMTGLGRLRYHKQKTIASRRAKIQCLLWRGEERYVNSRSAMLLVIHALTTSTQFCHGRNARAV